MNSFTLISVLLGGLGIFFFGMKLMSDSLQALFAGLIRKMINSLSSNSLIAVIIGTLVTILIQSSSTTNVMAVGLVQAGLITLKQAICVIFGANIGATITGWIISFKANQYGLVFVAIGFMPSLFLKSSKWQEVGSTILGLGLIYIGLQTMSHGFLSLKTDDIFLQSISYFTADNYNSYLACILMGFFVAMIIQSQAAMLAITIAMASTGIINFHSAVSLVLGQNIGATITTVLASVGANVEAKRAARVHACFNLFGVLILLLALPTFFNMVDWLTPGSAESEVGFHVAMAHTLFNLLATFAFLPFIDHLAKFVTKITPDKADKETPHLLALGDPRVMMPATSMAQAESEIRKMADIVSRMFILSKEYWADENNNKIKYEKVLAYEQITDNIHKELTLFLCYMMVKPLTHGQSEESQSMVKIADELESIADYLERLVRYRERFEEGGVLEGDTRQEFLDFMNDVEKFFLTVKIGLFEEENLNLEKIESQSTELQIWADTMRSKHIERISKGTTKPMTVLTYSDMVVALRKIRAHTFLMAKAIKQ